MRSTLFRYSILLFLGLAFILNACAPGDPGDPPIAVTPDITIPSTLQVIVTINEDQEASDGRNGKSVVTLQFRTNEILEDNYVIFNNGESVKCNGIPVDLSNAASYSVRMNISTVYQCDYLLHGKPFRIFNVNAALNPLSPKLQRPVGSNPIRVSYTPDYHITNFHNCTVQVTANAPGGSATGDPMPQNGSYTGPNISSLSGPGNLVMTRTCTPFKFDNHNKNDDKGSKFDALDVTYTSTASVEVTWVP